MESVTQELKSKGINFKGKIEIERKGFTFTRQIPPFVKCCMLEISGQHYLVGPEFEDVFTIAYLTTEQMLKRYLGRKLPSRIRVHSGYGLVSLDGITVGEAKTISKGRISAKYQPIMTAARGFCYDNIKTLSIINLGGDLRTRFRREYDSHTYSSIGIQYYRMHTGSLEYANISLHGVSTHKLSYVRKRLFAELLAITAEALGLNTRKVACDNYGRMLRPVAELSVYLFFNELGLRSLGETAMAIIAGSDERTYEAVYNKNRDKIKHLTEQLWLECGVSVQLPPPDKFKALKESILNLNIPMVRLCMAAGTLVDILDHRASTITIAMIKDELYQRIQQMLPAFSMVGR